MSAVAHAEFDDDRGAQAEGAEATAEIEKRAGSLRNLTAQWEDVQRTRLSSVQRGLPDVADKLKPTEDWLGRQIRRELEQHPIWPWLSQFPGLGGVHTARLVALIGDPHRFPGRVCGEGHHHTAADNGPEIGSVGGCGVELADGTVCTAPVGPVRRGTGTRSLWHYLGLHVVDGRSPRKTKGKRSDWSPAGRTTVLMPGGIAEQIVRQRVPHYRDIYDTTKERLTRERAVGRLEIANGGGPFPVYTAEVVESAEIAPPGGLRHTTAADVIWNAIDSAHAPLRPFQIDAIARKVAAKAFVGDLLREWKSS